MTGIPVVYSLEKPGPGKAALLPLADAEFEAGRVDELGVLPGFRARILPVLGTMPGLFGLCIANHILTAVAGYPVEHSSGKNRSKLYEDIQARLVGQESRLRGNVPGLRLVLTEADIGYVVEEVFKGRSVVSDISTRLVLTRWAPLPERADGRPWGEADHRLGSGDVVLMTKEEARTHEADVLVARKPALEVWGPDVVGRVARRRAQEASYARFR